jgi:hypothetical protein
MRTREKGSKKTESKKERSKKKEKGTVLNPNGTSKTSRTTVAMMTRQEKVILSLVIS